jgi:hypothetical protein
MLLPQPACLQIITTKYNSIKNKSMTHRHCRLNKKEGGCDGESRLGRIEGKDEFLVLCFFFNLRVENNQECTRWQIPLQKTLVSPV